MLPIREDAEIQVAEPFRPYERLVKIKLLKKTVEVPEKPGKKFALAVLSVFESGDHPLRQVLLESGLPILPGRGQAPR